MERPSDDGLPTAVNSPIPASTMLVIGDPQSRSHVLMLRRQPKLRFLGGAWVYPGGSVDPADAVAPTDSDGRDPLLPAAAAACRELFEETGLLVAVGPDGKPPQQSTLEQLTRRSRSAAGRASSFNELLIQARLRLATKQLLLWAHWVTPSAAPVRFDTLFFVVRAPPDQTPDICSSESTEMRWIDPRDWSKAAEPEALALTPPTLLVLRELAEALDQHGSLDALLIGERHRPLRPVLPKLIGDETGKTVVLPWDPDYSLLPGDGIGWDERGLLERADWPSRLPVNFQRSQ